MRLGETFRGYALSEFIVLPLTNRLAFKSEQHLYFQKHQCAAFVLPVMNEAENTITVKIFPNDSITGDTRKIIDDIANDIKKEDESIAHVLKNFPAVKAEAAGGI